LHKHNFREAVSKSPEKTKHYKLGKHAVRKTLLFHYINWGFIAYGRLRARRLCDSMDTNIEHRWAKVKVSGEIFTEKLAKLEGTP